MFNQFPNSWPPAAGLPGWPPVSDVRTESGSWVPGASGVKRTAAEAWPASDGWNSGWQSSKTAWNEASVDVEQDVEEEARPHATPFLQPTASLSSAQRCSVIAMRETSEVVVRGEAPGGEFPPITSFAELSMVVPAYATSALAKAGITVPYPIQQFTLPYSLRGFDVIGIAKTGSGKTLAFLLTAIAHCERQPPMPPGSHYASAVVLAPVRELADQIAEEAGKLVWYSETQNHPKGIGCVALFGGGGAIRRQQLNEIQKGLCQIAVGTPGRMIDFLQSGDLKFDRVVFFVLDEADRMLDGGFEDQINEIASAVRADRQTLFFSATWPTAVRKLAKNMRKAPPIRVSVGQGADDAAPVPTTRSDIVQEIIVQDGGPRRPWPDEVVRQHESEKMASMNANLRDWLAAPDNKVLVFVNTKTLARELAEQLQGEGFAADHMSADLKQWQRSEVVQKYKVGEIKLVITTDVMARGLDIPGITHVLVYDCYGGIDDYVHRIGRTSRGLGGPGGRALIFYEFDPKYASMPGELIVLLEGAGQHVPPLLREIATDVESGVRKAVHGKQRGKKKTNSW